LPDIPVLDRAQAFGVQMSKALDLLEVERHGRVVSWR
jgi:hypothetical protein